MVNTDKLREVLESLTAQCSVINEIMWTERGGCWYDGSLLVSSKQYNDNLAPIIERALRAAYTAGLKDGWRDIQAPHGDVGVTVGVTAMLEES